MLAQDFAMPPKNARRWLEKGIKALFDASRCVNSSNFVTVHPLTKLRTALDRMQQNTQPSFSAASLASAGTGPYPEFWPPLRTMPQTRSPL